MRVLTFANYSAGYRGNFIAGLETLEEKIKKNGGEVIYIFPEAAKQSSWTAEKENIYFFGGSFAHNVRMVKKLIKQYEINIVHTHFSVMKYDAVFKLARLTGSRFKYVRHMHMMYKNKSNAAAEMIKRFVSNGDKEIACSAFAAEQMEKCGFKNIITVDNAVDFSRFDNVTAANNNNILMMGYDFYTKGVDLAIQAVMGMKEKTELRICAASGQERLKAEIIEKFGAVPPFVEFLPPTDNVGRYYADAGIFLSAGREESFCFAIREAGYCGCITVGSDIPAHRISGALLFKNGSAEDLRRVLEYAVNDYKPDREKQRAEIKKCCSLEAWSDAVYNVYESVQSS